MTARRGRDRPGGDGWCGTTTIATRPGSRRRHDARGASTTSSSRWRLADHGLNYRRFFAVNTLAGIRVEDHAVFDASHVEIGRWFDEGLVDGLRVDHPDGLRDPAAYLDDLAQLTGGAYVLVEKILEPGEALEPEWATAGTTGYDVLGLIDRVLTDPAGQGPLTALDARLRGGAVDWHALIHDTKRAVADGILGSEVRRVVRELGPPVGRSRSPASEHGRPRGRRRGAGGLLPGVPLLPPGRPRAPRRGVRGCPPAPARPRRDLRPARAGAGRPGATGGAALPADQRAR